MSTRFRAIVIGGGCSVMTRIAVDELGWYPVTSTDPRVAATRTGWLSRPRLPSPSVRPAAHARAMAGHVEAAS